VITLYNVKISIQLPNVRAVLVVPQQKPLLYEQKDGRIEFVLPQLVGHQMIALELY
jgi:hypothetical protein